MCSEELASGIANARLVIFEHSGHTPFVEEPERFVRELEGFLTKPGGLLEPPIVSTVNGY